MSVDTKELKFTATEEKGEVSAILAGPGGQGGPDGQGSPGGPDEPGTPGMPGDAHALLVLGHGAGTNMRHRFMEELSGVLNEAGIATFRFNYPYSEKGGGMDGEKVRLATVRAAIETAKGEAGGLPVFAGGHSMSGRMVSMACAREPVEGLQGIVFFAFPLHSSKKNTERAEHLKAVEAPMLFLSGQRDSMADLDLLRPVVDDLDNATLHVLDTADHGFKVLKRRNIDEPVMKELARVSAEWMKTAEGRDSGGQTA